MVSRPRLTFFAATSAAFLAVVAGVEVYTRDQALAQTYYYSRTLAPLVWEVNTETAEDYLELILSMHPYRAVRVVHDDGSPFVEGSIAEDENVVEQFLQRIGLIRDQVYGVPITHEDITIGRIETTRVNRNIYIYLSVIALIGIGYGVLESMLSSRRARQAREVAEEALSESKVRLQTVVSGAPVILFSLDRNGIFTLSEGKGLEKLGLAHGELVGRSLTTVESFSPSSVEDFRRALAGETFASTRESGGLVFESWYSPLRDRDGRITGVIGVSSDISELRQALTALEERDRNIRRELALARVIHRTLLPSRAPTLPGFDFGMIFIPSGDIGGDFVDFFPFRENRRLGVVFADITGHGVPAALLSAMFKVLINDVLHRDGNLSVAGSIAELNRRVAKEFPPCNFASTFYLVLDATARRMTYVSAAQEAALLFRSGEPVTLLETGGPALGLIPPEDGLPSDYEEGSVNLMAGDMVFLYTDGLVEIENERHEMLTRETLIEWLQQEIGLDAQTLVDRVYARVLDFAKSRELPDDVAVVAVRVL